MLFPLKLSFLVIILLWVTISATSSGRAENREEGGGGGSTSTDGTSIVSPNSCQNCSICPYPCHTAPPSIYGAPPPPLPPAGQVNCTPNTVPVQCCQQQGTPPPYPPYYGYQPPYSVNSAAASLPSSLQWCLLHGLVFFFNCAIFLF